MQGLDSKRINLGGSYGSVQDFNSHLA